MYAEPERSRNPPKAISFPLIYVATCVRVLREATSIAEVSPSSDTCDNTLENLGRKAGDKGIDNRARQVSTPEAR
jgi:hypothetical protein